MKINALTNKLILSGLILSLVSGCTQNTTPTSTETESESTGKTLGNCPVSVSLNDIPDEPVTGKIKGQAFSLDKSEIENGILELAEGEEFFADKNMTIFMFLDEGTVPNNKTITVSGTSQDMGTPHIHLGWKEGEGDNKSPQSDALTSEYSMVLAFDKMNDYKIKGKIAVCLPDEHETYLSGTFEADVDGYILNEDGTPDLTRNNFKNFEYLVKKEIEKQHPRKAIFIAGTYGGLMLNAEGSSSTSKPYAEMSFGVQIDDVLKDKNPTGSEVKDKLNEEVYKFQFHKSEKNWNILNSLNKNEFFSAHPTTIPENSTETYPREYVKYKAAQYLEADVQKNHPDKPILDDNIYASGHSHGIAVISASYKLGKDDDPIKRKLVFKETDGDWHYVQDMKDSEKLDYKTGKIVTKEQDKQSG